MWSGIEEAKDKPQNQNDMRRELRGTRGDAEINRKRRGPGNQSVRSEAEEE